MSGDANVTQLLRRYCQGDTTAFSALSDLLYPELKSLAHRRVRPGQEIGATTLVQETFIKLLSSGGVKPEDRKQFFGLAATIMRQVIIDDARQAKTQKRQGLEVEYVPAIGRDDQQVNAEFLLRVNEALDRLAEQDKRLAQVFEYRYFGGYSIAEIADILGSSERSAERFWSNARKFLAAQLGR
ncbi:MAG: ECF-type sigma factor [Pseudomonadota bacterium]